MRIPSASFRRFSVRLMRFLRCRGMSIFSKSSPRVRRRRRSIFRSPSPLRRILRAFCPSRCRARMERPRSQGSCRSRACLKREIFCVKPVNDKSERVFFVCDASGDCPLGTKLEEHSDKAVELLLRGLRVFAVPIIIGQQAVKYGKLFFCDGDCFQRAFLLREIGSIFRKMRRARIREHPRWLRIRRGGEG